MMMSEVITEERGISSSFCGVRSGGSVIFLNPPGCNISSFFSSSNPFTPHTLPFTPPLAPSLFALSHLLPGFISSDWSSCQRLWHRDELHRYKQPATRRSASGNQGTTTENRSLQGHNGESSVSELVCVEIFHIEQSPCVKLSSVLHGLADMLYGALDGNI